MLQMFWPNLDIRNENIPVTSKDLFLNERDSSTIFQDVGDFIPQNRDNMQRTRFQSQKLLDSIT